MLIGIALLIILSILAFLKQGRCFFNMNFNKYLLISGILSLVLFINRALQPEFTQVKFLVSLVSSVLILLFFSGLGYFFFNRLCPNRKEARYLYFSAYLIFLLAACSQYPFTSVLDMLKKQAYIDAQKDIVDYYKPTAALFGIKDLRIRLIDENMLGASVLSNGKEADVVITTGLKKLLNERELRFVLSHEFTHYQLGHYKTRMFLGIFALLLFFLLSHLSLRLLKFVKDEGCDSEFRLFLKFVPIQLLLAALISLFPLWLCREQEFIADIHAVTVTGEKAAAISAFEKSSKNLFLNRDNSLLEIFETHPSIEERIEKVKNLPER